MDKALSAGHSARINLWDIFAFVAVLAVIPVVIGLYQGNDIVAGAGVLVAWVGAVGFVVASRKLRRRQTP